MKKQIYTLLLLSFTLFSNYAGAQFFTVKLAGGYAWPGIQNSEGVMGPYIDPYNPGEDALAPMANIKDSMNGIGASKQPVHGSYGKGMNFTLGLGYSINKYFGVELGISYLKSATISASETRQLTVSTPPTYSAIPFYLNANITTNAIGVSLMPSIIVKAPFKKSKVIPYARVGISLPVFGGLTDHISIDQNASAAQAQLAKQLADTPYYLGAHTQVTLKTEGTVSIGFNGALGVTYTPLPFLSVFVEVNGQHLVTKAKSSKITQWDATDVNGKTTSLISARGVYRTQFNFVDELNGSSNNLNYNTNTNTNKPKDDLRPTGSFDNIGLNVGLTFNLGKKTLVKKKKDEDKGNDDKK